MKNILALSLSLMTAVTFAADKPMTETFKVDSSATKVGWVGKKVLGQHNGNISVKNGALTFAGDLITAGEIVVDMKTISVSDIPTEKKENGQLVTHLSNADFFDAAKYPESKIVIKSSEKTDKGLLVKADLTMIGKTKPIEFLATVTKTGSDVKAKSDIVIDRTKWDLKYGSSSYFKSLGNKAINNEFTLSIDLTAKK